MVDASIWIDQLHRPDEAFAALLYRQVVVVHPFVAGEILLGNLRDRAAARAVLDEIEPAPVADDSEVLNLIGSARLFGSGIGYVDAHLVASTLLMAGGRLWTRDRRLAAVVERLGIGLS